MAGSTLLQTLDGMLTTAVDRGLLHHIPEDEVLDGRTVRINGRDLVQFGSCSYLGLEHDERLKQGARDAAESVGVCFSSSRAYMSAPLYRRFEELCSLIFDAHVLVTPTTTLGHLSAIPVLCEPGDALIIDHQAHQSLHMAATLARAAGSRVELVRHDRIDLVEQLFHELARDHRRVWFAADGVYSMFGDLAPVRELVAMLDREEQFHLYIDDAHGMSWCGKHGRGYALDQLERVGLHERMVVATSFVKGFAAAGAALVFANPEWKRLVQTCGGPMIFSGPVSPLALGVGIASAKIHLSDEIEWRQAQLRERIRFCNSLIEECGLPLVSDCETPIRFIGTGSPSAAQELVGALMDEGFFTNVAHFPAVPMRKAGLRFTLTLRHSHEDIRALVRALSKRLPDALAREGLSIDDVREVFGSSPVTTPVSKRGPVASHAPCVTGVRSGETRLEHFESIEKVSPELWDQCLGERGSFTWQGLRFLEQTFSGNPEPWNNWKFHYYLARNSSGRPMLASFFTESIWKHDMLAPAAVSKLAETRRKVEPDFLTSGVMSMGCLLSEGNHLYLDRSGDWREALGTMLQHVGEVAASGESRMIVLRDLPTADTELDEFLVRRGFLAQSMPESMQLDVDWTDGDSFLRRLSSKARYHQRRRVLPFVDSYEVRVLRGGKGAPRLDLEQANRLRQLYQNVKAQSLELNTFDLPKSFFARVLDDPRWELILLSLKPSAGGDPDGFADAVGACFVGPRQYVPMVIGLDYRFVHSHGLYRQCLHHTVQRAQALGLPRVLLGMGAALEKRRFGARPEPHTLYVQADDHYYFDVLSALGAETHV